MTLRKRAVCAAGIVTLLLASPTWATHLDVASVLWEWDETSITVGPMDPVVITSTLTNTSIPETPGFNDSLLALYEAEAPFGQPGNFDGIAGLDYSFVVDSRHFFDAPPLDPVLQIGESLHIASLTLVPASPIPPGTYSILPFLDAELVFLSAMTSYRMLGPIEITVVANEVPEPSAVCLFGAGLVGLVGCVRRRR